MKSFVVAGHVGKDVHLKIKSINDLPSVFRKLIRNSTPLSNIDKVLGDKWNFETVMDVLKDQFVSPITYSYGGRGANVAYGAALLGASVELISIVGDDFDKEYPGFFGGGYRSHLIKSGVMINDELVGATNLGEGDHHGVIMIKGKETSTIYCVKDMAGTDFYFINDLEGAHVLATRRLVPVCTVDRHDSVFLTSGEPSFNVKLVDYAYTQGKEIIFDVGVYETTPEYLRRVIPKCDIVLGNDYEIGLVMEAFGTSDVSDIFQAAAKPRIILLEDKMNCVVNVYVREEEGRTRKITVGPVSVEKTGNSVGCCDGIAAGFMAFHARGFDVVDSTRAGLILCSAIWRTEGVHEGMLNRREFYEAFCEEYRGVYSSADLSRFKEELQIRLYLEHAPNRAMR